MPQRTLFDGWDLTDLRVDVHLNARKPGGLIAVTLTDENGKLAGMRKVQWNKDRDVSDLGLVLKDVADAFLWAPHLEAVSTLEVACRKHLPEVSLSL